MIPIAIVTRNRHAYLDIMLRSLSATRLPRDQVVVVFDDASDESTTRTYLYGDARVEVWHRWPRNANWRRAGLEVVESRREARGIAGIVDVVRLGASPLGVVNATCAAARNLFERFGAGRGIMLLQDDLVFAADWAQSLAAAEARCETRPPGLIAGMRLNVANPERRSPTFMPRDGLTAQCYFVTPGGIAAASRFLNAKHRGRARFDDRFCAAIRRGGLGVYLMYPPVCQHFGMRSLVRPEWDWEVRTARGRVDLDAHGPFVLADSIRKFASAQ